MSKEETLEVKQIHFEFDYRVSFHKELFGFSSDMLWLETQGDEFSEFGWVTFLHFRDCWSLLSLSFPFHLYCYYIDSELHLLSSASIHPSICPSTLLCIHSTYCKHWYVLVTEHAKMNESWCLLSWCLFLKMWNESPAFLNSDPPGWSHTSQHISDPVMSFKKHLGAPYYLWNEEGPLPPQSKMIIKGLFMQAPAVLVSSLASLFIQLWKLRGHRASPSPWACLPLPGSCRSSVLCLQLLNFLPFQGPTHSCVFWASTGFWTLSSHILLF